jgi:predicted enzyme related to lactoylglutathione lyase
MTDRTHLTNGIGHFDIAGPDAEALRLFYGAVLGWQIDAQGPGYALVRTPGDGPDGAISEADEPSLTVGVVVPDLDGAVGSAQAAGGSVVMPTTDNGWVVKARIADPAGNLITLIQG